MRDRYILDEAGDPVVEPNILEWARWFTRNADRKIVARDVVGSVLVSTVFLGLDHNFTGEGPPVLWETMTFDDSTSEWGDQRRYTTREEALVGHRETVEAVKAKGVPQ